jgi:hypothetical protein
LPSVSRPRPELLAVVLAFGAGCATASRGQAGAAPPSRRAPARAAAETSAENPATAAGAPVDPRLTATRRETQAILEAVAAARGLPKTHELTVELASRSRFRDLAKAELYEHTTPEHLRMLGRIEASFGVIPPGVEPEKVLLDMLEMGVLGLYDPGVDTLFVGDFVGSAQLGMVVGHEIAHGLQDMHFDLQQLQQPLHHRSDAETARTYLVEGDAQATYFAFRGGSAGLATLDQEVLLAMGDQALDLSGALPYPILARQLQLPYADGAATIVALVKRDGWAAVDRLYSELPETTEQMLHIDKLRAREAALEVTVDTAALQRVFPAWTPTWYDTLGEAALLSMLAHVESSRVARRAAAGWGGSAYVVFDDPAHAAATPIVAGAIAWDTIADAREFEPVFRRYLQQTDDARHLLVRKGATVHFALRVPPDVALPAVARALTGATRVGGGRR